MAFTKLRQVAIVLAGALFLAACTEDAGNVSSTAAPSASDPELAAADTGRPASENPQFRKVPYSELESKARAILISLQADSFRQNREYCGFIGVDKKGLLKAAYGRKGSATRCSASGPRSWRIIASYHTHGAYDGISASEWPSLQDVRGDMRRGLDGFISTPGGRFWHINPSSGFSRQVCGEGCLSKDSKHKDDRVVPQTTYTLRQLSRFYSGVAKAALPMAHRHEH